MKTTETPPAPTEPKVSPNQTELGVEVLRTPWGVWYWDEPDGMLRYVPRNIRRAMLRLRIERAYRDHPDAMVRLAYAMKLAANQESQRITVKYPLPDARRKSPLHREAYDAKEKAIAAGMVNPKRKYGVRMADGTIVPKTYRRDAWEWLINESTDNKDVVVATYDGELWFEDLPGGGFSRKDVPSR